MKPLLPELPHWKPGDCTVCGAQLSDKGFGQGRGPDGKYRSQCDACAQKEKREAMPRKKDSNGSHDLHASIRKLLEDGAVVHTKPYSRELPVPIGSEEEAKLSTELATTVEEREAIEEERREAMAEFRERISSVSDRQKKLAANVRGHCRTEAVQCIEILTKTNEVHVCRLDDGTAVEIRTATKDDLQPELPLGGQSNDQPDSPGP